ncbi:DUF5677 domain-containing protein [Flavobacterium sp. CAN_S2]|uniref:DUF5677 domain-containing protein n=1 Tax=Flavobacterium sp. CAN_S2 TaxID=2787726 RepID=UPI0018C8FD4F
MKNEDKISILINESKKVKLSALQESLDEILNIQGFLLQKVYELKPKLKEGEVYIETLIIKLIFASKSVLSLSKPQSLGIHSYQQKIEIIDVPSILILSRSIIETFLTLEYLYFDKINDSEKNFRFKLWKVSGFMSRQAFADSISESNYEKLKREEKLIEQIKEEIKSSPFYPSIKSNELWKLDKFGLPRLKSWGALLESSRLKSEMFKKTYSLYSNYAHSEFISMMQLNEGSLNKDNPNNISFCETAILFVQMINSLTILLLKERFKELDEHYSTINNEVKVRVELWSSIATK